MKNHGGPAHEQDRTQAFRDTLSAEHELWCELEGSSWQRAEWEVLDAVPLSPCPVLHPPPDVVYQSGMQFIPFSQDLNSRRFPCFCFGGSEHSF